MICRSCGAEFDEKEAKCPFCGTLNEKGAKRLFFKKLNGITDTIEDMSDRPKKVFKKRSAAALLAAAAVIFIGILTAFLVKHINQKRQEAEEIEYEKQQVKQIAWENENFPILDQWYEEKNFEAISDFRLKLIMEDSEYDIFRWRHNSFIEIYSDYSKVKHYIDKTEDIVGEVDAGFALYKAMTLIYQCTKEELSDYIPKDPDHSSWGLTREELDWIEEYRETAQEMITNILKITPEEQERLHKLCEENGYMGVCYDYIKGLE